MPHLVGINSFCGKKIVYASIDGGGSHMWTMWLPVNLNLESTHLLNPPEVRGGECWGLGVFMLQYLPLVNI